MCDRAVLLERGERLLTGEPKIVVTRYQRLAYAPEEKADEIRAEILGLDGGIDEVSGIAGADASVEAKAGEGSAIDGSGEGSTDDAGHDADRATLNGAAHAEPVDADDADEAEHEGDEADTFGGDGFGDEGAGTAFDTPTLLGMESVDRYDENLIAKSAATGCRAGRGSRMRGW